MAVYAWIEARTFEEVVAAQDPAEMAGLERGEHFTDPSIGPFHGEMSVSEDRYGSGEWRVVYFDDVTAAATSRSLPVLRPRGGRAITSHRSNPVALRFPNSKVASGLSCSSNAKPMAAGSIAETTRSVSSLLFSVRKLVISGIGSSLRRVPAP